MRIAAAFPLLLLAACHREEPKLEKTVTPVRVAPVATYQPKGGGKYSASIVPARQVTLAFRVPGIVQALYTSGGRQLEPGDMVAEGTVLAKLREEDYRNSTAQAQSQVDLVRESRTAATAQLAQAQAARTKAEADFKRAQTLLDSQSLTRPEYDSAKAQLDIAIAQYDAARSHLEGVAAQIRTAEANTASAQLSEKDTALVAPFAASVVQRNLELGMLAGPSQPAYTLADIGTVKAVFGVPDTVVVQLRAGKPVAIAAEALPERGFRGTVSSIASVADPETRLFQVEVTLENRQMMLKPGMIASLTLNEAAQGASVLVVPLSAVIRDRGNTLDFSVMVVENKIAKARRVTLGPTFGDVLSVTSGLNAGESVIRSGANMVTDGEVVEVIP